MFASRIELDSVARDTGALTPRRLTTVVWTMPRIVLAEAHTHRTLPMANDGYEEVTYFRERTFPEDLSKNSASSRAVPTWKMVQAVLENPYVPEKFSAMGPGMSEAGWLEGDDDLIARAEWLEARDLAVCKVLAMLNEQDSLAVLDRIDPADRIRLNLLRVKLGSRQQPRVSVHKQDANRLLEPFGWVSQVVTGDDIAWSNFFALRTDRAAHPAIRRLARMTYLHYRASTPAPIEWGVWHLPFVGHVRLPALPPDMTVEEMPMVMAESVARCAWVSYEAHDKDGSPEKIRGTVARLTAAVPVHASPLEHQATPALTSMPVAHGHPLGNLRGYIQLRKLISNEHTPVFAPSDDDVQIWKQETGL